MGGMNEYYMVYGANSMKMRDQMNSIRNVSLFPCVFIEWDDTPGFGAKGILGIRAFGKSAVSGHPGDYGMQSIAQQISCVINAALKSAHNNYLNMNH